MFHPSGGLCSALVLVQIAASVFWAGCPSGGLEMRLAPVRFSEATESALPLGGLLSSLLQEALKTARSLERPM